MTHDTERSNKDERRIEILDAAERVFLERGIAAATMEQIARKAGVSKGGLYKYFETKDELFLSIAKRALDDLNSRLARVQAEQRGSSGLEWVHASLDAYFDYAKTCPDRFRVALSWISAEYSVAHDTVMFRGYREALARAFDFGYTALELGKQDGSVRPDLDTESTLLHMWGATTGVLMLLFNQDEVRRRLPFEADFDEMLRENSRMLMAVIKNPDAFLTDAPLRVVGGGPEGE